MGSIGFGGRDRILVGDRAGVRGEGAPASRVLQLWRGYPEVIFLLGLGSLLAVGVSGIPTHGWVPWTFQELTLQRIPDPVVPFTVGATIATSVVLTILLTPRIGVVRAALIGVSVPVSVVGIFEISYLFLLHPSAFWPPANPNPDFWGYVLALVTYAAMGLVGGGWWRVPRWWGGLLIAVVAGFVLWFAAGVPLPQPSVGGHTTPSDLLGVALVGNVALKWGVFVLMAAPIAMGARSPDPRTGSPPSRAGAIAGQFQQPNGGAGRVVGWLLARFNARLNREAVCRLAPKPTDRVLEIGFGPGVALRLLSERVTSGVVEGIDPSEVMLNAAIARNRRAVDAGTMSLRIGTASRLPWDDGTFHEVLSLNNVFLWRPLDASLDEVRRVLRPQGRLLVGIHDWAARGELRMGRGALSRAQEELSKALERSRFTEIHSDVVRVTGGRALLVYGTKPSVD